MKPLKNKVSITLDEDIIKQIKELAENDDRSFSQYINMVLKIILTIHCKNNIHHEYVNLYAKRLPTSVCIYHSPVGSLFIIKYFNYFFLFFKSVTRIIAAPATITIAPISRKMVP